MSYIKYLLTSLLFFSIFTSQATAKAHIDLDENTSSYTDFTVNYLMEKPGQNMDIEEVSNLNFAQETSNAFSFGYKENTFWFHFSVFNNSPETKNMVLEFTEIIHKTVDLFVVSNHISHRENGLRIRVKNREIKESNPSFPLTFSPYENKDIYLKVSSIYGVFGAIQLKTKEQFNADLQLKKYLYLIYFTAVIVIGLYNLILFFYLKEKIYLYYIAYVFIFVVWAANYKGILLPFISMKTYDLLQITIPLFFIFFILFSQAIVETKKYFPVLHKILSSFILVCLVSLGLMFLSMHSGFYFINAAAIPLFPLLIVVSFGALYHKLHAAKIYLIALSIYIIGMSLLSLLALGILPYTLLLSHSAMTGSFFEIILFSLLLAYRINAVREDSKKTQQELILQQRTESTRLFHTVAEKTKALHRAKEQLEKELAKKEILEQHLKHLASTDPMTGLLNRRAFFDICDQAMIDASTKEKALTCLIVDIDHFKNINDTYGHDMGDKVIKNIAQLMLDNTRTLDHVGRIGGEEFAILMSDTDMESAYQISDRLRENISKYKMLLNDKSVSVTVSIGLSYLTHKDKNIHTLLKRADTALYEAKENGRNQVCCI
ncbi:MAG TPA: GGDEF domain-containing protein [Epsilonproteobacteria bacterium]|nr:GGDEF domain-containing protein [Campylobacterota bacterium]